MKKYILVMLAVIVLFLAIAYVRLFTKQTNYHKAFAASTNSVLVLSNFDNAKVKIVASNDNKIEFNLKGPAQDILSIIQAEDGIYTTLDFADKLSEVTGTISVPEGMLLDITLSEGRTVTIDDISGKKSIPAKTSFLVDTNNLDSMTIDDFGHITLNSTGDLIVWDDETWDSLENNGGDTAQGIVYCGIGSQAIRNYCCETENSASQTPACSGLSYWVFNNSARDCAFVCEPDESGAEAEPPVDCGIGSQAERDSCCASQHIGEYQGCIGSWRYNNAGQACQFSCDTFYDVVPVPVDSEGGGSETAPFSYGDAVSDYCVGIISDEERDLCCNDTLKNNLSSGPRPGFPDCIGTWKFDTQSGCKFECAEHAEMMEILNELKQQTPE